jgi:hypothetical protein
MRETLNWRAFSEGGQPTPPQDGQQRAAMRNGGLRFTGEIFFEAREISTAADGAGAY